MSPLGIYLMAFCAAVFVYAVVLWWQLRKIWRRDR